MAPLAFVGCFELFEVDFVVLLSSIERIVGGSCIGSPAKMSFFALNIGIQQTFCNNCSIENNVNGSLAHRFNSLGCFVDDDDIKFLIGHLSSARGMTSRQDDLRILEDSFYDSSFSLSVPERNKMTSKRKLGEETHSLRRALTSFHNFFRSIPLGTFPFAPFPLPERIPSVVSSSSLTSRARAAWKLSEWAKYVRGKECKGTDFVSSSCSNFKDGLENALLCHDACGVTNSGDFELLRLIDGGQC